MASTTINFPVQYIEDDYIQLILKFNHDGSDRVWSALDKEIVVESWGDLHLGYEIDDPKMVPSNLKLTIGDNLGFLDSLLFEDELISLNVDVRGEVVYKLNGAIRFVGNILEDSFDTSEGNGIITFEAGPDTSILNQTMLYDEYVEDPTESDSSDDLYYNAINPFSYTRTNYKENQEILLDIYKIVNPDVSLDIAHNWTFKGDREDLPYGEFDGFSFSELMQNVDPLFFDNSKGLNNLGDLLRKFAVDWGCFTGMINSNKAFFRKLFYYNPNDLQEVNPIGLHKGYRHTLIDYVRVNNLIGGDDKYWEAGTYTKLEDKFIERDALPGFWSDYDTYPWGNSGSNVKADTTRPLFRFECNGVSVVPQKGALYSNNGCQFEVNVPSAFISGSGNLYTEKHYTGTAPESSGVLTRISGVGDNTISFSASASIDGKYWIRKCRAPEQGNTLKDSGQALADFWFNFRHNIRNCRVDKITCRGIGIDYLKNFHAYGNKYQIMDLKEFPSRHRTELLALYLGRV